MGINQILILPAAVYNCSVSLHQCSQMNMNPVPAFSSPADITNLYNEIYGSTLFKISLTCHKIGVQTSCDPMCPTRFAGFVTVNIRRQPFVRKI
jgi:hypothetical protein